MIAVAGTMASSEAATSHSDADVHRQSAAGKGEIDRRLMIADRSNDGKPPTLTVRKVSITTTYARRRHPAAQAWLLE